MSVQQPAPPALQHEIDRYVQVGFRIETQTPTQAVVVKGKRPNHILHLILTLITLGVWAIVWIGIAIFGGEKRRVLSLQADGAVRDHKA
jgi:hypothetical protein